MSNWYLTADLLTLEFFTKLIIVLGNLSVIVLFSIPYKDISEIYYTKKIDKFPYMLLVCTIINCFFWLLYGLLTNQIGLIVGNGFGLTLNTIFWLVYIYCTELSSQKKLILTLFTLISLPVVFNLWFMGKISIKITGTLSLIFSMLLSVSPMQNIGKVIQEKDNSYIPIRIVLVVLVSAILWSSYGFIKMELVVLIPNVWALFTSAIQIYFYNKYSIKDCTNKN